MSLYILEEKSIFKFICLKFKEKAMIFFPNFNELCKKYSPLSQDMIQSTFSLLSEEVIYKNTIPEHLFSVLGFQIQKYKDLFKNQQFSENFISFNMEYFSKEQLDDIWKYQNNLSEVLLEKYVDKINFYILFQHKQLSKKFILKYFQRVKIEIILQYQKLSENIIRKLIKYNFLEENNWDKYFTIISKYQSLSESFIEEIWIKYKKSNFPWDNIVEKNKLSESFISKYISFFNRNILFQHQNLSESFLESLQPFNNQELNFIFKNMLVSERFILKYINKKVVKNILLYQKIDCIEYLINNYEYIHNYEYFNIIIKKYFLSEELLEKYKYIIGINNILKYQKISLSYLLKIYRDEIYDRILILKKIYLLDKDYFFQNFKEEQFLFFFEEPNIEEELIYHF